MDLENLHRIYNRGISKSSSTCLLIEAGFAQGWFADLLSWDASNCRPHHQEEPRKRAPLFLTYHLFSLNC